MPGLTAKRAAKYRTLHRVFLAAPFAWLAIVTLLEPHLPRAETEWAIIAHVTAFLLPLVAGLLGLFVVELLIIRAARPGWRLHLHVALASLFGGPLGKSWCARRLLEEAVRKGEADDSESAETGGP